MTVVVYCFFVYCLGSISSSIILSKLFKKNDPRTIGSGNPGATNMFRTGPKWLGFLTLVLDFAKGFIPVFLLPVLGVTSKAAAAATIVAVVLGHMYPIWHRFRGGKGVATYFGLASASSAILCVAFVCSWVIVMLMFKKPFIASLAAVVCTTYFAINKSSTYINVAFLLLLCLIFWRHKGNIKELLRWFR